ncbi:MAG: MoaD/ThiS family protein [Proteobacteria bacterium]|nr:MoaD/ThiS family protein [Pseudomonadota bacterium]MBU1712598.1 MoaD/ThiS family protein [Pseudomonadota bacterium]
MEEKTHIIIKLFASLTRFTPDSADKYPISSGTSIRAIINRLGISEDKAKLIFINGIKGELDSTLKGGERIGIFPPVGGG